MRLGETRSLKWSDVDTAGGEILVRASSTKTKMEKRVDLSMCPTLTALLAKLELQAKDQKLVFGGSKPFPESHAQAIRKRLILTFGAPVFTWQQLRHTCGTYLTCAPGIYKAASVFMSAKRLGHSVVVAERNYLGAVKNISPEAKMLEEAMGSER